jgi:hypothetical protein
MSGWEARVTDAAERWTISGRFADERDGLTAASPAAAAAGAAVMIQAPAMATLANRFIEILSMPPINRGG